jgi:hypothetical protein
VVNALVQRGLLTPSYEVTAAGRDILGPTERQYVVVDNPFSRTKTGKLHASGCPGILRRSGREEAWVADSAQLAHLRDVGWVFKKHSCLE